MIVNSINALLAGRKPMMIAPEASVARACQVLAEFNISALAVVEDRVLVGVISARDVILRCTTQGRSAMDTLVSEIMTPDPETIQSGKSVAEAQKIMRDGGICHLPVVDRAGQPMGLLSMRDIEAGCI